MIQDFNITAENADAIYEMLVNLHAGKSPEESALLNSRLVLILSSHIGNVETLNRLYALGSQES